MKTIHTAKGYTDKFCTFYLEDVHNLVLLEKTNSMVNNIVYPERVRVTLNNNNIIMLDQSEHDRLLDGLRGLSHENQTRYKKQRDVNCEIDREAQTITYRGNKIHALLEGDWYAVFGEFGSLHYTNSEVMVDDIIIYVSDNDKQKDWYKELVGI